MTTIEDQARSLFLDEARQWLDRANDSYRHVVETRSDLLKVTRDVLRQDWDYFELQRREANVLIDP
jgi:hypothetical protein